MTKIYFDNAATTAVSPAAAQKALEMMTCTYGNPSSLHEAGFLAEKELSEARRTIANATGVEEKEIIFTSGGSAADNLAISGILKTKRSGTVITSAYEHPAVSECLKSFTGFNIIQIKPENGIITPESLRKNLTDDTVLVTIMHVNNETGAVNPIRELCKTTKRYSNAIFHTDAVQGFMKEQISYSFADMASFSSHKNHAPKGAGALYVRSGIHLKPLIFGGGQEQNIVSGTENTPAICGWAASVKEIYPNISEYHVKVEMMKAYIQNRLKDSGAVVLSPENSSPYVLFVSFPGYIAENILHYLSAKHIYVSTGSACSSHKTGPVFKATGNEEHSKSSLRISLSHCNTDEECRILCDTIDESLKELVHV